jgi:hypothetical protein
VSPPTTIKNNQEQTSLSIFTGLKAKNQENRTLIIIKEIRTGHHLRATEKAKNQRVPQVLVELSP